MKKVFIADEDDKFQETLKSLCRKDKVELLFYTSSMEVLPLIEKEPPDLVFVSLELSDINDFVMYDLLKKADTKPPVPVLITYEEPSEKDLKKYKKLKFQPAGYHKKTLSDEDLQSLVIDYLGDDSVSKNKKKKAESPGKEMSDTGDTAAEMMGDDDDVIFTEILGGTDPEEHLASLIDDETGEKPREAVFSVADGPSVDLGMDKTSEREKAARVVSLEKQNHFLRTENKRLTKENEILKEELDKMIDAEGESKSRLEKKGVALGVIERRAKELESSLNMRTEEYKKLLDTTEKEKNHLEKQVSELYTKIDELNDKLTDKQRELVAKDHEFEKKLKREADELLRETEDRLGEKFKNTEEQLRLEIARLQNEKMRIENTHKEELDAQAKAGSQLQQEIDQLKKMEISLNAAISDLEDEKEALSKEISSFEPKFHALEKEKESLNQRLMSSEKDLTNLKKEKEEKEKTLTSSVDKLTKELQAAKEQIENNTEELNDTRNRIGILGELLQKALSLTQEKGKR